MNHILSQILAVGALMIAGTAAKANILTDAASASPGAVNQRGVAVRASVRIALGRGTARQNAERVTLNLSTGPVTRADSLNPRLHQRAAYADWMRLSWSFDQAQTIRMNGRPIARLNGRLAADDDNDGASDGDGGGVSGWAIAGGIVLVGLGASYLALEDAIDCNEGGDYVCE